MSIGKQVFIFIAPTVDWESQNPTLEDNYIGIEGDTNRTKMGDGVTSWIELDYSVLGMAPEPAEEEEMEEEVEAEAEVEVEVVKPAEEKPAEQEEEIEFVEEEVELERPTKAKPKATPAKKKR